MFNIQLSFIIVNQHYFIESFIVYLVMPTVTALLCPTVFCLIVELLYTGLWLSRILAVYVISGLTAVSLFFAYLV